MPAERMTMRQVREVLRLKFCGRAERGDRPPHWRGGVDGAGDDRFPATSVPKSSARGRGRCR